MQEAVENQDIISQLLEGIQRFTKLLEPREVWQAIAWMRLEDIMLLK